jgi:hypothetical protein
MSRLGLIHPNWNYESSIRFECRSPHLDSSSSALETQVAP